MEDQQINFEVKDFTVVRNIDGVSNGPNSDNVHLFITTSCPVKCVIK